MKSDLKQAAGYGLIVLASCFFGGSASLGKSIMQAGVSTIMLMEIRSVVTSATLLPLLLLIGRRHLEIKITDLPQFLLLAIPGLAIVNASYYYALSRLSIALAVFIQFTAPVLILLFGLFSGKEKPTRAKLFALLLSLAGTYMMVQLYKSQSESVPWAGLISAVVATLSFAFYVILSHRMGKKHSSWTLVFYGYTIAALFWCVIQNPVDTWRQVSESHLWGKAVLFAVCSTLIPFAIFLSGLRRVTPTGGAIASTSETVTASIFAFIVLGETLTGGQILGAALILSAILILILQSKEPPVLEEV